MEFTKTLGYVSVFSSLSNSRSNHTSSMQESSTEKFAIFQQSERTFLPPIQRVFESELTANAESRLPKPNYYLEGGSSMPNQQNAR